MATSLPPATRSPVCSFCVTRLRALWIHTSDGWSADVSPMMPVTRQNVSGLTAVRFTGFSFGFAATATTGAGSGAGGGGGGGGGGGSFLFLSQRVLDELG